MWRLLIESDANERSQVTLKRDEYRIGRGDDCYVRLTERNVSRRHARFVRHGPAFLVEDLGSYNGTYLNGARLILPAPVSHGDLVQIGDYCLLVQQEATEPLPEPPPAPLPWLPSRPARLVMFVGPTPGAEFPLTRPRMILGRGDVDIGVAHDSVSRTHCEIAAVDGGRYEVLDLGSSNGLWVNGTMLRRALLDSGDVLAVGEVAFKFLRAGETIRLGTKDLRFVASPRPLGPGVRILPYALFVFIVTVGGYLAWLLARR
ncbi:MAG TPA: FHA domain-containing protein [Acidimicrobiales bacterium]|nr:FHA domain-containing protein [Acidimicrobiales bacterium]